MQLLERSQRRTDSVTQYSNFFLESGQLLSYFANLLISGSGPGSGILPWSLKGPRSHAKFLKKVDMAYINPAGHEAAFKHI